MAWLLLTVMTCWAQAVASQDSLLQFEAGAGGNLTLKASIILSVNYTLYVNTTVVVTSKDTDIVLVETEEFDLIPCDGNVSHCVLEVELNTVRVGRTVLTFDVSWRNDSNLQTTVQYTLPVSVVVQTTPLKTAMSYLTSALLVIINFVMGCKIQWKNVKEVFKNPLALFVGLSCQILLMPLIAFALANAFFLDDDLSLGLLIVGTAPGGGISNLVAAVTDGDLDLSASMTITSTILAFGVMPLWLFTYGQFFSGSIQVPYTSILINLGLVSVPLFFGVLLKHKKPYWAQKLIRLIRPFSLLVMLVMIGLGIYSNFHVFDMLSWRTLLPCLLLPVGGLVIGVLAAMIFCQKIAKVKTIALEVGVQNTILAISVIQLSWASPESDLIFIMPASILMLTLLLMLTICVIHFVLGRYSHSYRKFNISETAPQKGEIYDTVDISVEKMIDSGDIILKEGVKESDVIEMSDTKEFQEERESIPQIEDLVTQTEDTNIDNNDGEPKLTDKVMNTPIDKENGIQPGQLLCNGVATPEIVIRIKVSPKVVMKGINHDALVNDERYEEQSSTMEFESEDETIGSEPTDSKNEIIPLNVAKNKHSKIESQSKPGAVTQNTAPVKKSTYDEANVSETDSGGTLLYQTRL